MTGLSKDDREFIRKRINKESIENIKHALESIKIYLHRIELE